MTALLAATLRALAFLSRLPAPGFAFRDARPLGEDAPTFPLVGLVVALPGALLLVVAMRLGLSASLAALLAVALTVALTGALHEDGLGDTADALFGHRGREDALRIMKDSRIGTYGALALGFALALKTAFAAEIAARSPGEAAAALLLAAAASRGAMAWLWSSLPSADPGGLADRAGRPSASKGRLALAVGAGIALLGGGIGGIGAALLPLVLGGACLLAFRRILKRRLGGQTGDCLGAGQQVAELGMLLGYALTLRG